MANEFKTTDAEKLLNTFIKDFNRSFERLGIKQVDFFEHKNYIGIRFWYPVSGESHEYEVKLRRKK